MERFQLTLNILIIAESRAFISALATIISNVFQMDAFAK